MTYEEIVKEGSAIARIGKRQLFVVGTEKWLVRGSDRKVWYRGSMGPIRVERVTRHGKIRKEGVAVCRNCKEPLEKKGFLFVRQFVLHVAGACTFKKLVKKEPGAE